MDASGLIDALRAAIGDTHVLTGTDIEPYVIDERGVTTAAPVAVARPRTTEEVAAVVKACVEHSAVVVTQGGHTGLSGGAQVAGTQPSVVVSLRRMTSIESIDPTDSTAVVEAGVTIEAIQDAAAAVDRMFAPDWGARGSATIGGAASTNAGGINVLQHGTTRNHILGLEVVLADGRVWNGLRSLRKDSSGYSLRELFIGAEGTLGIITRVVVRLLPVTHSEQSALLALRDLEAVAPLLDLARSLGPSVNAFELLPEFGVSRAVAKYSLQRPLEIAAEWYVLVRVATHGQTEPAGLDDLVSAATDSGLVTDAAIAVSAAQEQNLWRIRDELAPTSLLDRPAGAKYDAAVPVGRVVDFIRRAHAIIESADGDWTPYSFGHVGDGNIHLYALAPSGPSPPNQGEIETAIDELVFELGGTLSAEHGVGQALRHRIGRQKPDIEFELARRIKQAFDPTGVFNPDKTIPAGPN